MEKDTEEKYVSLYQNTITEREQFNNDTKIVAEQIARFVKLMQPAHITQGKQQVLKSVYHEADVLLEAFSLYRIMSCSIEDVDDLFEYLNKKMNRFYTAMQSIGKPVIYGIVSQGGTTNLVIGIYDKKADKKEIQNVIEGILDRVELQPYVLNFSKGLKCEKKVGLISAIPSLKTGDDKQKFSLASLIRSLNGKEYTVFFISRPLQQNKLTDIFNELISIKDKCFAVSKRNISRQQSAGKSIADTIGRTNTDTDSKSDSTSKSGGVAFVVSGNASKSKTNSSAHSVSESYSKTITDSINNSESNSFEIQNSYALELISYVDKAIERFRQGNNNGMWETVISYSTDSKLASDIIRASISGEFAKPDPDILPQIAQTFDLSVNETKDNTMLVPKILLDEKNSSPLCNIVTSEELGFMCTLPDTPVPDFELKKEKMYPLMTYDVENGIKVGNLCDGKRSIEHMSFSLSYKDLVKHTFVCGMTGSGKTTTVKQILKNANVPFLVIESAKKEYRNIKLDGKEHPQIYTLGKPEINCLKMNPFYIQCGVSPQMHIDFLKDLFNASFSFYGPMPYILEKCLQNIYKNKGWDLRLGFHPYLVNMKNAVDFFDADYMAAHYKIESHKYLFPTMQDLKKEIERYIDEEMNYEGEIAGNIKTAIKARLESLCSGPKGYMFNTYEYTNMEELLSKNTVFELEGLAADDDKAFCVGLLIILINEYRQVSKETVRMDNPLSHILVVEEAHRLLKNTNTDRISEDMGNPKGKAVEHFSNMIAEMRAYGQGVIVAEQIPSKLAPDVIKNSSNKIIQRLVALDDQILVANSIGLSEEECMNLGNLTTGMALCHKEGMNLPVLVKIPMASEIKVSDGMLYGKNLEQRMHDINVSMVKEILSNEIELYALRMINTIMIQNYENVERGIRAFRQYAKSMIRKKDISLITCIDEYAILAEILSEQIFQYWLNGAYSIKTLIPDELKEELYQLLVIPNEKKMCVVKEMLSDLYKENLEYKGCTIISQLIKFRISENIDIDGSINQYFFETDDNIICKIRKMVN